MGNRIALLILITLEIITGCAQKPPLIHFQNQTGNIGTLDLGHPIATIHFKFENSGGGKLIVKNAASDCSCTIANFTKKPLNKGQWGDIAVTVNYKHIPARGNVIRNIVVQSNTLPMLHTLTIKMSVR